MMEWIEGSKTLEKEFDLAGNMVPVRTLKFNFGVSILLGKGSGIVDTKRG